MTIQEAAVELYNTHREESLTKRKQALDRSIKRGQTYLSEYLKAKEMPEFADLSLREQEFWHTKAYLADIQETLPDSLLPVDKCIVD